MNTWLEKEAINIALPASCERQALQKMARMAVAGSGLAEGEILEALLQRERLGSTAIGNGIAIPHARLQGLSDIACYVARLESPVPFHAEDKQPVDLLFMILVPETEARDHLTLLARISRLLHDPEMVEDLRNAMTCDEMYRLLIQKLPSDE